MTHSKEMFEIEMADREREAVRQWAHLTGAGWLMEVESAREELRKMEYDKYRYGANAAKTI